MSEATRSVTTHTPTLKKANKSLKKGPPPPKRDTSAASSVIASIPIPSSTTISATTTQTTAPSKQLPLEPLELVICHYEEDLGFLEKLQHWNNTISRVVIYHKGNSQRQLNDYHFPSDRVPKSIPVEWITLKNVGREGHTIGYHCLQLALQQQVAVVDVKSKTKIKDEKGTASATTSVTTTTSMNTTTTNTDDAGVTLFIQGGWDAMHAGSGHVYPINEWHKYRVARDTGYHCAHPGETYTNVGMIRHHSKWLKEKEEGHMKSTEMSFADVYQFLTRRPFPTHTGIQVSYGNYFAVQNRRIRAHHPDFYRRWVSLLENHVNPETGHYIERLTRHFFSGKPFTVV